MTRILLYRRKLFRARRGEAPGLLALARFELTSPSAQPKRTRRVSAEDAKECCPEYSSPTTPTPKAAEPKRIVHLRLPDNVTVGVCFLKLPNGRDVQVAVPTTARPGGVMAIQL